MGSIYLSVNLFFNIGLGEKIMEIGLCLYLDDYFGIIIILGELFIFLESLYFFWLLVYYDVV